MYQVEQSKMDNFKSEDFISVKSSLFLFTCPSGMSLINEEIDLIMAWYG